MFERIRTWLRLGSLDRREHAVSHGRPVENYDAVAASVSHSAHGGMVDHVPIGGGMPPGYVKAYDEGRLPKCPRPRATRS